MARRWLNLALATIVLAGLSLWAFLWESSLVGSLHDLQAAVPQNTPAQSSTSTPPETAPIASRVVLVVVSGLRSDVASAMPTLQRLSEQGAVATSMAVGPTYTQPTWTALLTGAPPDITGGDLLADAPDDLVAIAGDHVLSAVASAGYDVAIVGHRQLNQLMGPAFRQATTVVFGEGLDGDRQVIAQAKSLLATDAPQLLVLHLDAQRLASRDQGALSDQALLTAAHTDAMLTDLVEGIDLATTCVIVTSDHGLLESGGYGGDEPDVVRTPLVMAGQGIRHTTLGEIPQTAIAPTVTALLGVAAPAMSEGNALIDALETDPATAGAIQAGQTSQALALTTSRLEALGAEIPAEPAQSDEERLPALNAQLERLLARRASSQRLNRAPLGVLVLGLPWLLILHRPKHRIWYLLLAAAFVVLAWHGQFQETAGGYSFSRIADIDALLQETVPQVVAGVFLGTVLAVALMVLDGQKSPFDLWEGLLQMGLLVAYLLACILAVAFVLVGFRVQEMVPDVTALFVQVQTLLHLTVAGALLALLPAAVASVALILINLDSLIKYTRDKTRAISEAIHAHRSNR